MKRKRNSGHSLGGRLRLLLLSIFIPMLMLFTVIIGLYFFRSYQYEKVSGNISLASGFSQDFKNNIDLKMYYYATGSEYATGIPLDEVESALQLANVLSESTSNKESLRSIRSVINLCGNLRERIVQISETDAYDERIEQLESNVYILTELIQNYMYNYLYSEATELAGLQKKMDVMLRIELTVAIIATLSLVAISVGRAITISKSITRPIDEMYNRVQSIGEGELVSREPVKADDEKLQTLSNSFEEMIGRLSQQLELNMEEAKRIRAMELMLLQAQINPHFLYNTLDTIIWLIETEKNSQAVEMVTSLSNYFRSSLSKGKDVITIAEEEIHVRSYLEIQTVRYKDILTYETDFDDKIGQFCLPKLTLQPLVENALYHGIKLKRGLGNIHISGNMVDDRIVLKVSDTGIGMNEETLFKVRESLETEHSAGFGMAAVYKRLKLLFGRDCSFDITSRENEGTEIRISIPAMDYSNILAFEGNSSYDTQSNT